MASVGCAIAALEKGVSEHSSRNHENCSIGHRIYPVSSAHAAFSNGPLDRAAWRQNCGEEFPAVITIPPFSLLTSQH